jgi:uncharacterized membrane protein
MYASFLMGLAGGQRALTPLAAVSVAAACHKMPEGSPTPRILAQPVVAGGLVLLAIAELLGDKMKTAPARIVPVGLAARFTTSAIAGACLAPRGKGFQGAIVGGVAAVGAAYPGWRARLAMMSAYGQTRSGLLEDIGVIVSAWAILHRARDVS